MTILRDTQKTERWLITGGCGFIGTSLVKELLGEGCYNIRLLDNLSVGSKKDLDKVCEFSEYSPFELSNSSQHSDTKVRASSGLVQLVVGDITDDEACIAASQDIDVVVHLAANTGVGPSVESPRSDMESNVIGTFNMLEAARLNHVKRFIFASSGAPVGECEPPIHEEIAPHPVSPYGASKLAGEAYCSAYYRTFGLETVALRFGNVYGPGSWKKNSVVAKFIKLALANEICKIYGDGKQTRDFIYISDLVRAIRLSSSVKKVGGEVFQIATNQEHNITEIAERLQAVLKEKTVNMKVEYVEPRLGDVKRNYSDTTKANKLLKWSCNIDVEQGLDNTVNWFIQNK